MQAASGATCIQHLSFMRWADERMLSAVAEHMPGSLTVLQHIYLAELVWFRRVRGEGGALITHFDPPPDIGALQEAWPALHEGWLSWAAGVADWSAIVRHSSARGDWFEMPAWQIVLHVVNHGSFHRGQVAAMLRANGVAPPPTDLILWYREMAQET